MEGALAEASDLRSIYLAMTDLVSHLEWLTQLQEICTEVEITFNRAQVEGSAKPTGSVFFDEV